jgi:hypothetical protein
MVVLGLIRGESFFQGKPTSYWRGVVVRHNDWLKASSGPTLRATLEEHPPCLFDRLGAFAAGLVPQDSELFLPCDPAAIPVYVELLWDRDADVRSDAAFELGEFGPQASAALSRLVALLEDDDASVRWRAANALAAIETDTDVKTSLLMRMLKDSDPLVRWDIVRLLGEFATGRDEVIAALNAARNDEDRRVREEAAAALNRIGR